MEDILLVKPTVLVSVPTLFQRIYDGVKAKVARSSPIEKAAFNVAMAVALDRRQTFNRLEEL
jgi:long-chain acyl-CoA synthetase